MRRSLRIALANGWIVVLLMVLGAGGAYAWSKSQPKVYSATAVVRVFDPNDASPGSAAADARVDPAREVQIEVLYARSTLVSDEVNRRLGSDARLVKAHSITPAADSNTVSMTVKSTKRTVAQDGAQLYATVFVEQRQAAIAQQYSGQIAQLQTSVTGVKADIATLDRQIAAGQTPAAALLPESETQRNLDGQRAALVSRESELESQIASLSLASTSNQSDLGVVQTAPLPKNPVTPLPHRDAALGAVIGLLVGLALVALRLRLRDKVVTSADLAAALPSLSFIVATPPRLSMFERRRRRRRSAPLDVVDGRDAVREAYGVLRASVLYDDPKPNGCSLLVTSAHAGEGKTVIAANLALSLARGGARVVVVDCDLRNPSLHRRFGVDDGFGLSSVLVTSASARSAVRRVGVGGATLDIVPAGPTVADPADLMVRHQLADVLSELKRTYDYVILDGPPLLPAADGLALARIADGVLLVVRSGKTKANALHQVDSRMRNVSARVAGAALVGVRHDRLPPAGSLAVPSSRRRAVEAGDTNDSVSKATNGNGNGKGKSRSRAGETSDPDVLIL